MTTFTITEGINLNGAGGLIAGYFDKIVITEGILLVGAGALGLVQAFDLLAGLFGPVYAPLGAVTPSKLAGGSTFIVSPATTRPPNFKASDRPRASAPR